MKIKQLIPIDSTGLLKNASEFLQHVRDKNIKTALLTYSREDDGFTRTYIFNRQHAEFNLILDIAKHDLLEDMFKGDEAVYYEGEEDEY